MEERRSSGYSLSWLHTLSLKGLRKLATSEGISVEDARVEELIAALQRDENEDEDESFRSESACDEESFRSQEDEPVEEEEAVEEEAAPVVSDRATADDGQTAAAPSAAQTSARSKKPWTVAPFVPQKSEKVTIPEPFSLTSSRPGSASVTALATAALVREAHARKLAQAAERREAAMERQRRIATAFKESQANSNGGPQRIRNKAPAAWDAAPPPLPSARRHEAAA